MQFLLHLTVTWPPDCDPEEKERRIEAEGLRAASWQQQAPSSASGVSPSMGQRGLLRGR
jgi:hypothetical protein